jgi:large subunit ribosomal protein L35
MPKMKSKRGAAKRFKATGSGRVKRSHAFAGHILTKKTPKRKRNLRKSTSVSSSDIKNIKTLILAK